MMVPNMPVFMFSGAAAIAMYFMAGIQYLELVFDHYYRFVGLGIALFGVALGLALDAVEKKRGLAARLKQLPSMALFIAVTAQIVAGYAAVHLTYGAGWTFLLLALLWLLPYIFWSCTCSVLRSVNPSSFAGSVPLILGAVSGLFVSPWLVAYTDSLSMLWLLSAALMAFSVLPLVGRQRLVEGLLGVWIAAALVWLAVTVPMSAYPQWDAGKGTVTRPIAMALAKQKELAIESTDWLSGLRIDNITGRRSRKDGYGWRLVNGTAPVAFAEAAEKQSYPWWERRFPLLVLPFEAATPERVLSIEPVQGPGAYVAALTKVDEYKSLGYAEEGCVRSTGLPCMSALPGDRLSGARYDLIQLSVPHPLRSAWVGTNTQDEYLVSGQLLDRYLSLLDHRGMLAITAREEVLFLKLLVSVWSRLLPDSSADVMDLEGRLKIFRLGPFARYRGSYRYLILASRDGFTAEQLAKMEETGSRMPIEQLIYGNQVHSAPWKYFDNVMASHALEDVQTHLSRYTGWRLQSSVRLLEPSSLERPDFFRLSAHMHPFLSWLLTGVTGLLIYAVLFSFRDRRDFESSDHAVKPAVAVLLVQLTSSAAAGAFLLAAIAQPAIIATQVPQQGFLWMISLLLLVLVGATRREAGYTQEEGRKASQGRAALILVLLLALHFSSAHVLQLVQDGRVVVLWGVSSLLLLVTGWLGWGIHRRAMLQLRRFYSLPLSWGWIVSGSGALVATIVSTQAGWSAATLYAAALYGLVFVIASWVSGSCPENRQTVAISEQADASEI